MNLRLDWVDRKAALWAAENWHYSKSLSSAKNAYIGVWEDNVFAGCVVFGIGAGAVTNGKRFGLDRTGDVAELTRVALRPNHKTPVSRVVAVAIRLLKKQSPGLRLLISFADPAQGHHGGIYQAGGWIYAGETKPDVEYKVRGKWVHHRTATSIGSAAGLPSRKLEPKLRYLMPLDDAMRAQIAPLAKPYPKRAKQAMAENPSAQRQGSTDPHAPNHEAA
jgi:hypothetical protein